MDVFDRVEEDVLGVFERWADKSKPYYEQSCREFSEFVCPFAYYEEEPNPNDVMLANLCYTEWFLFEYDLVNGQTPLECYVALPPAGVSEGCLRRLRQVAETQRFSRYAIREKFPDTGDARLLDLFSGEEVLVHSPTICGRRNWKRGSVSMRIACVDGTWMQVGKATLYDRAPAAARCSAMDEDRVTILSRKDGSWGFLHHELSESYFLNLLYDVIGLTGAYSDTCHLVA